MKNPEPTYFASGSNHAGEIAGLADCQIHVGVAVHHLNEESMSALLKLSGTTTKVFVDSGAFSEIGFGPSGPYVQKPITHDQWIERLEVYVLLARALGSQVYLVAPDQVAFQAETIERLGRYAHYMQECRALGANVLVPHQKGALSLADFGTAAAIALGFSDYIPAIPMKKDATSQEDLCEYLQTVQPAAVHLLGRGPQSRGWGALVAALTAISPSTVIYCDSVMITSMVGRSNGRHGAPRILTAAFDAATAAIEESMWGDIASGHDYTDQIVMNAPEWTSEITKAQRKALYASLGTAAGTKAPTTTTLVDWLQENSSAYTDQILDSAYSAWVLETAAVTWRKRDALNLVFRGQPAPKAQKAKRNHKPIQLSLGWVA